MFEPLSTVSYVGELNWGFSIDKNLHISSSSRIFLYRNKDENTIATFQIVLRKSADSREIREISAFLKKVNKVKKQHVIKQ